jgi:hypothetical protein
MRRRAKTLRHLSVLFITLIIFALGILIGNTTESLRVQHLYTQLQEQDLEYQNILTESEFLDYLLSLSTTDGVSCQLLLDTFSSSINHLETSRIKLENYLNAAEVKEEELLRLKDQYAGLQINYWIMNEKITSLCGPEILSILYFYTDDNECGLCEDQGIHLSYVKEKLGKKVLVFSFDAGRAGPISLLMKNFNVSSNEVPTLVIQGDKFGFNNNKNILNILCEKGLDDHNCVK